MTRMMLGTGVLVFLAAAPAAAHIKLLDPPARSDEIDLAALPCGDVSPTRRPTVLTEGETITVSWEVGAHHGGTVRIAFSPADDLNFDDYVLADEIPDNDGDPTSFEITVPDMPCDACTLQLFQSNQENDNYVTCADIQVLPAEVGTTGTSGDVSTDDADTGDDDPTGSAEITSGASGQTGNDTTTDSGATAGEQTSSDTDPPTREPGNDDDAGGCGCRSTPGVPPEGLLFGVLALAMRRSSRRTFAIRSDGQPSGARA